MFATKNLKASKDHAKTSQIMALASEVVRVVFRTESAIRESNVLEDPEITVSNDISSKCWAMWESAPSPYKRTSPKKCIAKAACLGKAASHSQLIRSYKRLTQMKSGKVLVQDTGTCVEYSLLPASCDPSKKWSWSINPKNHDPSTKSRTFVNRVWLAKLLNREEPVDKNHFNRKLKPMWNCCQPEFLPNVIWRDAQRRG